MPAIPTVALRVLARALGTGVARRAVRDLFLASDPTPAPLIAIEWYAARAPAARVAETSALAAEIDAAPTARGVLSGESIVVKDSLDVAGAPTALGLRLAQVIADEDAVIVARARAAGGRVIGKAKMTELGMDGLGALMPGPMPENPLAPGHFAGGSSTGTAVAVARGHVRFGVGGDGLGSVRIPAAYTGLVGLKPGADRLPSRGYRSVAPSMDVPGPMARTVEDCALLFSVLAGEEAGALAPIVPPRVGIVRGLGPELATDDVARAFSRALDAIGAERVCVDVEGAAGHGYLAIAAATFELARSRMQPESAQGLVNLALGRSLDDADRAHLDRARAALRDACRRAIDRAGVLAMPTTAVPAPAIRPRLLEGAEDALLLRAIGAYTPLANCTGLPAIAVPCGIDARGRPLSIMFVGAEGSEHELLAIARAIEQTGLARAPI